MYKNLMTRRTAVMGISGAIGLSTTGVSLANSPPELLPPTSAPSLKPLKIGFVYVAPLTDGGWVYQHNLGRLAVEKALGSRVTTTYVENVAEGPDAERVIRDLASTGHGLIFTPSFGYMEPTLKVAAEYPLVKFESITGYKTAPNVAVANARYYEGRYLAGVTAGHMSQTGLAGYVAGFPIPEVLQGINAFTLGMQSVNPKARVKVIFLNAWFDPPAERDAAITLMNQGADVLAYHTGSSAVMVAAQAAGKVAVAYHSDLRKIAPDAQIVAVTHHWGDYYAARAKAVLEGKWTSTRVWGGLKQGMVAAGAFGHKVPQRVQTLVAKVQRELISGKRQVFAGPLTDNQGKTVLSVGASLTDDQILSMDFLLKGVDAKK